MRLVFRQISVDHGRLRRFVENILDILDLRNLRQLGDVERAFMEGETVRSIETFRDGLDLGLAVLLHNGGDFVAKAGADKHRSFITDTQ